MGFVRRLFGGSSKAPDEDASTAPDAPDAAPPAEAPDADAAERAYELELARSEQDRLDELARRQLRYAEYAWQPPKQGGERRADDEDPTD
jgi:hypothetical protein